MVKLGAADWFVVASHGDLSSASERMLKSLRGRMRRRRCAAIVALVTVSGASLRRFSSPRLRLGADAAIPIAIAAAQALIVLASGGLGTEVRLVGVVCAGGFVALRWRTCVPLAVFVVTFAAVFAQELLAPHLQSPVPFLAIFVASYSLGAHARLAALVVGVALGVPGVAVGHALGPPVHTFSDLSADVFFFAVLVLAPAVVGRVVRARAELAARLQASGRRLNALREQRVSGAVVEERDRIFTELERVMLGGLEGMAVHAEASSLEQVTALERAAREALAAMRGLLAGLRAGLQELGPSRSLSELHERVWLALAAGSDPAALAVGRESLGSADEDATLRRRGAMLSGRRVDFGLGVVAVVLSCVALLTTLVGTSHHGPQAIDALLAAATVAPIAWARRAPWAATVVAVAALLAHAGVAMPSDPLSGITPIGLLLFFPFALGARRGMRDASAGLLLCLAAAALLPVVDPRASSDAFGELAATAAVIVGSWAAGRVLAARSRMLSSLADAAIAIEREQRALAHERLVEERNRVARELHDAFAHSMTVIVLQAGAARRVWNTNTALAHQHAAVLRETVREVLGELRELILAVTHDPQHAPALLRIEGLVQRARSSGMEVELAIGGEPPIAAGAEIDLAAYRIVQEALTNAAKHAPGARVQTRIDYSPDGLSIVVENGRPLRAPEAGDGSGHGQGLQGMRERASACGGNIVAAPRRDGGFQVAASLPLCSS